MSNKEELIALLRVCNAPPAAIDVAEAAYELGYRAAMNWKTDNYLEHLPTADDKETNE
jgi:hypothetical protein